MTDYVPSALFVFAEDSRNLFDQLRNNAFGVDITPVAVETLMQDPEELLDDIGHVVVSGSLEIIKTVFDLAMKYGFSIRKVMLVKYSSAFVIIPGGFGTLGEAIEIIQNRRTGTLSKTSA